MRLNEISRNGLSRLRLNSASRMGTRLRDTESCTNNRYGSMDLSAMTVYVYLSNIVIRTKYYKWMTQLAAENSLNT